MKRSALARRGTGRLALDAVRNAAPRVPLGVHGLRNRCGRDGLRGKQALAVGLSVPMLTWAQRILRHGIPELERAVERGDIALYMAANIARWAPAAQHEALALLGDAQNTLTRRRLTLYIRTAPALPLT